MVVLSPVQYFVALDGTTSFSTSSSTTRKLTMGLMGIRLERNKGVKLWALGDFNRVWIRPIGALPGQAWFPSVQ